MSPHKQNYTPEPQQTATQRFIELARRGMVATVRPFFHKVGQLAKKVIIATDVFLENQHRLDVSRAVQAALWLADNGVRGGNKVGTPFSPNDRIECIVQSPYAPSCDVTIKHLGQLVVDASVTANGEVVFIQHASSDDSDKRWITDLPGIQNHAQQLSRQDDEHRSGPAPFWRGNRRNHTPK